MAWTNQGGFPSGGGGTTTLVSTTINNFTDAPITTYATRAALLAATPIADEIGIVSSTSGDGYEGTSWFWDVATSQWRSAANPTTVNGVAGPIITIDADDIAPTGTRQWVTPTLTQTIGDLSSASAANGAALGIVQGDVAALQAGQSTQDSRLSTLESDTLANTAAISAIDAGYGVRLTDAEADIAALELAQSGESARLNDLEAGQTLQDGAIATLGATTATHTSQIGALQASDATHTSQIAALQAADIAAGVQASALDGRLTTAELDIVALENGQAVQDNATAALTVRVTATEGDIDALDAARLALIADLQTLSNSLPVTYQLRSEKNQPGGYVGLLPDGKISATQLPFTFEATRDITPVETIAQRDALAATWGAAEKGYAVLVANNGDGLFFIWDGSQFLDFTGSVVVTSTSDVAEGTNLYFTNTRVANAPAVAANTAAITALNTEQDTQDGRLAALESGQTTQDGRLAAIEALNTTQTGQISGLDARLTTAEGDINAVELVNAAQTTNIATNAANIATLQSQNTAQDAAIAARLTSFSGRTGPAINPATGDYTNAQITNVATKASGATTAAALDNLKDEIDAVAATASPVTNKVTKGGDTGAFSAGTTDATNLTLIANNAARIVLNGTAGLTEVKGLTEATAATGTVTVNPASGAIHIDPNVRIPLGWVDGCEVTFPSGSSVAVAAGQMEIGGRLITIPNSITKNAALAWVAGTGAGGQVGTWGNGSQYVYVGYNTATAAVDVFVSNSANVTTSNGFTLKLLIPLYVESSAIRLGTHNPKLRRFTYTTPPAIADWNVSTAANGTLYAAPIPVYPNLAVSGMLYPGLPTDNSSLAIKIGNQNQSLSIANIIATFGNFDGTAGSFRSTSGTDNVVSTAAVEWITSTGQVKALRVGSYLSTSNYSRLNVYNYSWS